MFDWLRRLDLGPLEWSSLVHLRGVSTPYIGDVIDRAMLTVQAVVVLFTPDDFAQLRSDLVSPRNDREEREVRGQPRPNVLFETGLALARHPENTVLVEFGELRGLSDLTGRLVVRLEEGVSALHDLAGRLRQAGCAVDTSGNAWLDWPFPDPPVAPRKLAPPVDALQRVVHEILQATVDDSVADDLSGFLALRLRHFVGAARREALFSDTPGRGLSHLEISRLMYELSKHGLLRTDPDRPGYYVRGQLPSY